MKIELSLLSFTVMVQIRYKIEKHDGLLYFHVHRLRVRRISSDVEVLALPREIEQDFLVVLWAWTWERKWKKESGLERMEKSRENCLEDFSTSLKKVGKKNLIRVNLAEDYIYRDLKTNALGPKYRYALHLHYLCIILLQR